MLVGVGITIAMIEPKYRRALNQEQVEMLELLYRFRFVTIATLRNYFSESYPGMNIHRKLDILADQGFIGKRYFDNFRLLHKPVVYYLLPAGARKLSQFRDEDDTDQINIKNLYRDSTVSERFAMHCVAVFDLYNHLGDEYGNSLDFYSKSDLADVKTLPNPAPDAYVTLKKDVGTASHFFLEVLDDDAHLMADASKKIRQIISYKRSGNWALHGSEFPSVIFVCSSDEACKRVQKRCEAALNKAWVLDMTFTVTTLDAIELDSSS